MINKVILLGNVGADPETHVFDSGNKIVRLRMATTERIFNPATSVWNDHTEWHSVVVGQRHANFVEMYVKKGAQIYVEGRIRNREWGEGENRRTSVEIRVDEIRLLGRRGDSGQSSSYSNTSSQPYNAATPTQTAAEPQQRAEYSNNYQDNSNSYSDNSNSSNYGGGNSYAAEKPVSSTPAWQTAEAHSEQSDITTDDLPF